MNQAEKRIKKAFPKLASNGYAITSEQDPKYNCIAWAADENKRWWDPFNYWPSGVPRESSIDAYVKAYETKGYMRCNDGLLEDGFEKIVIYVGVDNRPSHAAKQLLSGKWTSKLGQSHDIVHDTVAALEGSAYGVATVYMKRPT